MDRIGTALLTLLDRERKCLVRISLDDGIIEVHCPWNEDDTRRYLRRKPSLRRLYTLTKFQMDVPGSRIQDATMRHLMLVEIRPMIFSKINSVLLQCFPINDVTSGLARLVMVPQSTLVRFRLSNGDSQQSELVFDQSAIESPRTLTFRIRSSNVQLVPRGPLLTVSSRRNLLRDRERLGRALGLFQRGRVVYRSGRSWNTIELSFRRPVQLQALGAIDNDPAALEDFLEKYLSFEERLSEAEFKRHRLAIGYLIAGCAGPEPIENKLISLFTSLEVIDDSSTLAKNSVARALNISNGEADLLVRIRNHLVHEGMGAAEALKAAGMQLKRHRISHANPFRVAGVSPGRATFNLHRYLLNLMIRQVRGAIGDL